MFCHNSSDFWNHCQCQRVKKTNLEDPGDIFGFGANDVALGHRSHVEHFAAEVKENMIIKLLRQCDWLPDYLAF